MWVLEVSFSIGTLKTGIVHTLHFFQKNAKEENTYLRGHNTWKYPGFYAHCFVILQFLPFQKIIEISHYGWRRGVNDMYNMRKIDLTTVFGYISLCIWKKCKLPLTHTLLIKNQNKNIHTFYDHYTHFEEKKNRICGYFGSLRAITRCFSYSSIISLSIQFSFGIIIFKKMKLL